MVVIGRDGGLMGLWVWPEVAEGSGISGHLPNDHPIEIIIQNCLRTLTAEHRAISWD